MARDACAVLDSTLTYPPAPVAHVSSPVALLRSGQFPTYGQSTTSEELAVARHMPSLTTKPASVLPASHSAPSGHSAHVTSLSSVLKEYHPAMHDEHSEEPTGESYSVPRSEEHLRQVLEFFLGAKYPAGQLEHTLARVFDHFPAGHGEHEVLRFELMRPASHDVHSTAPLATPEVEKPSPHTRHSSVCAVGA